MKNDESEKQKEFINSTMLKLKDEITKFIFDTNYSNIQSLYLRQQIDDYEKEYIKKNQVSKQNISVNNKSLSNKTILPLIINNKNPNICYNKNKLYDTRKRSYQNIRENINRNDRYYDLFHPSFSIKDSLNSEIK